MLCNLCGFFCNIDRSKQLGHCQIDDGIYISYVGLHFGEEPYLVTAGGSGTIFFLGCNLRCQFCQNYQISRYPLSRPLVRTLFPHLHGEREDKRKEIKVNIDELVDIFFDLKKQGAVNINFVSPTPYVYQIAEAIKKAKVKNFDLPFVYNTHGYDSLEALKILDGLIDIYLPDAKYAEEILGLKYSQVPNYPEINKIAIREMFRQVGHLQLDEREVAIKGILVRHLILPGKIENSIKILDFLKEFGQGTYISLMAQYHPLKELEIEKDLQRTLYPEEYQQVIDHALTLGLENCLTQELDSHHNYLPDFTKEKSF